MNYSLTGLNNKITLLLKRKDILISAGIVALSLLFAKNLFQGQTRKAKQLEDAMAIEEQKLGLSKEVVALNKEMAQMSSAYYKSDNLLSVEKLNELAASVGIGLKLVTPGPERDAGFYMVVSFGLDAQASYHNLGRFISLLESQPGIVKIEELSVQKPEQDIRDASKDEGQNTLNVNIKISQAFVKQK